MKKGKNLIELFNGTEIPCTAIIQCIVNKKLEHLISDDNRVKTPSQSLEKERRLFNNENY